MTPVRPAGAAPVLWLITLGAFITTLDVNIVAAGVPSIAREMRLDLVGVQWVSIGYVLPFASVLLVAGAVVDRWGQRMTLLSGLLAFGLGAVVGGLAATDWMLVSGRIVQGAAAAFLVPSLLSLLRTNLDARRRAVGAALWTASLAVALAIGPTIGGLLSEYAGWEWIFFVNLPFVAAMLLLMPLVAAGGGDRAGERPAVTAMVLVTVGLVLLTTAVVDLGEASTRGPLTAVLAVAGLAVLAVFVARERDARTRLVAPALLRDRPFVGALAVLVMWGFGVSGVFFFTPLLHQEWVGLSPVEAGLPLVLVAVAIVAATPLVPRAVAGLGPAATVAFGMALVGLGLAAVALVNHIPTVAPRVPGLLLIGVGSALTTPLTSSSLERVPESDAGAASALLTAARELSSGLGVALIGAVLAAVRGDVLAAGAPPASALASGFTAGLWVAAGLEVAGGLLALIVMRARTAPAPVLAGRVEVTN